MEQNKINQTSLTEDIRKRIEELIEKKATINGALITVSIVSETDKKVKELLEAFQLTMESEITLLKRIEKELLK